MAHVYLQLTVHREVEKSRNPNFLKNLNKKNVYSAIQIKLTVLHSVMSFSTVWRPEGSSSLTLPVSRQRTAKRKAVDFLTLETSERHPTVILALQVGLRLKFVFYNEEHGALLTSMSVEARF